MARQSAARQRYATDGCERPIEARHGLTDGGFPAPRLTRHFFWVWSPLGRGSNSRSGYHRSRVCSREPGAGDVGRRPQRCCCRGRAALSQAQTELLRETAVIDDAGLRQVLYVPHERPLTLVVDDRRLVTLMTLGAAPEWLTIGYLRNQRLLERVSDLESVVVDWRTGTATVTSRAPLGSHGHGQGDGHGYGGRGAAGRQRMRSGQRLCGAPDLTVARRSRRGCAHRDQARSAPNSGDHART